MLVLYSELELNEAISNGVIMSPPPFYGMVNIRGNVIFAEGLNVQMECLMGVSKILFAERLKVQMCLFFNV